MYVKRKIANIYKYEINNTMSTGYFDLIIQSQNQILLKLILIPAQQKKVTYRGLLDVRYFFRGNFLV